MSNITKEYSNPKNGGRERVYREGDNYYIKSNWGNGWGRKIRVSRSQIEATMRYTSAPNDVVSSILMG